MNRKSVKILAAIVILALMAGIVVMIYTSQNTADLITLNVKSQFKSNLKLRNELQNNTEDIIVYTVGTAAPFPSNRAQTCTAVFVNGKFFVFDVGDGAVQSMESLDLPLMDVDEVFLTHLHSDHFIDLPYLINRSWQMGRSKKMKITGPVGTNAISEGSKLLLSQENQFRADHHGTETMNLDVAASNSNEIIVPTQGELLVYNADGIKITAFDVGHEPVSPDFGYKIEYAGKKCVLSGDTNKNQNVIKHSANADLLIHEAMLKDVIMQISEVAGELGNERNATIIEDVTHYHSTNVDAAEVAAEANVKKLVLNHLAPVPDRKVIARLYTQGLSKIFNGDIVLANDGDKFIIN